MNKLKPKTIRIYCFFILSYLFLFSVSVFAQDKLKNIAKPGQSIPITVEDPTGVIDGYNLYLPKSYESLNKKLPLLIFLQGGSGVGGKIEDIHKWALPKMLKEETDMSLVRNQYLLDSFVVVCPHMTEGNFKSRQFYNQEKMIRKILKDVIKNFHVDQKRIYLTGLSRGGHGTWGLASKMYDVFAAVVPIAGALHGVESFEGMANTPIWVAHNTGDEMVDYNNSKKAIAAIEKLSESKFIEFNTETPKANKYLKHQKIFSSFDKDSHNAWTSIYSQEAVYKWLLRQSL